MTVAHQLLREPLDWSLTGEQAALLVREDARPFALVGDWAGGGAVVGSEPVRVAGEDEDPFALLDEQPEVAGGAGSAADAVGGGWFGWLGYGLARRVERAGAGPPRPAARPASSLAFYDHVLHLDAAGRWWFEALVAPERADALAARLEALRLREADLRPVRVGVFRPTPEWRGHAGVVAACRERIAQGDLFQANLSVRLSAQLDGDPLDLWARGVAALRPARAAWFRDPAGAVASLSPELFLERSGAGRTVRTAPIKGTAAYEERTSLEASAKDRAENVMIVDLMRNDLGRVCEPGSVRVTALCDVRAHAGVWHSVSEVEGRLRDGLGDADLLRATFPPGSVTGAPKTAALDVIAELESTGREAYTGAIGMASPLAGLELNVAIRTFESAGDGRLWLGVGGGVVADSAPAAEAAECATKAAPLLAAIGAPPLEPVAEASPAVRRPVRFGPRPLPRPDPARGVFETALVRDGAVVAAHQHLARLRASLAVLYGVDVPALAQAALRKPPLAAGRLRVAVDPAGVVALEHGPLPSSADVPLALRTFVVPGGLGAHKWTDRRLLDALSVAAAPAIPLLLDADGCVLEASRANVLVLEGRTVVTPPADGRILPGTTRAGLGAREETMTLERLLAADKVLLCGALRGLEAVATVDDVSVGRGRFERLTPSPTTTTSS